MREPEFEDADLVGKLIDSQFSGERLWSEAELCEVVAHQLAAPVVADIKLIGNVQALEAAQLCLAAVPPIASYAALFAHRAPPQRLLALVAEYAQAQIAAPEPLLPARVARRLYFTAAAVARVRCRSTIGDAGQTLVAGFAWLLAEPWIDEPTRAVLEDAIRLMHSDRQRSG